jgi:hypothetical protein
MSTSFSTSEFRFCCRHRLRINLLQYADNSACLPRHSSNIHHGMISTLVSRPLPNLTVGTKKILNIPILSLLMLRGRRPARDGMHLVASAPLTQGLDGAVKMGWRCCVLKRVEVDRKPGDGTSESEDKEREREKVPVKGKKGGKKAWTSAIVKDETEATTTGTDSDTPAEPERPVHHLSSNAGTSGGRAPPPANPSDAALLPSTGYVGPRHGRRQGRTIQRPRFPRVRQVGGGEGVEGRALDVEKGDEQDVEGRGEEDGMG